MARARRELSRGDPRRYRAMVRALGRGSMPPHVDWQTLHDANGRFWEGDFDRALARVEALLRVAGSQRYAGPALELRVLTLLFLHRIEDARISLEDCRAALPGRLRPELGIPPTALEAILRFHDGDISTSRTMLERLLRGASPRDATTSLLCYHLAAIAHAEGRLGAARAHLAATVATGGSLFVARWAIDTHAAVIAQRESERRLQPSLPRLFVGTAIADKLRAFQARLDGAAAAESTERTVSGSIDP